jgi:protein-(glutamine-N5) methyltransferase, release factor-specific
VNRGVLIPRPETEIIVNKTLKLISLNASKKILDIGTGSGCIMLSILKERPKCHGTAIDISKKALKVAITNAKMHHLQNKIRFINNDIDKFNYNKYDFILSNPPYINSIDIKRLDKDIILYEPLVALQAGIDGLRVIRKLIKKSRTLLKKNGKLIFEIGKNQLIDVIKLLNKNKFYINEVCKDLQSHPRVIVSTKPF